MLSKQRSEIITSNDIWIVYCNSNTTALQIIMVIYSRDKDNGKISDVPTKVGQTVNEVPT